MKDRKTITTTLAPTKTKGNGSKISSINTEARPKNATKTDKFQVGSKPDTKKYSEPGKGERMDRFQAGPKNVIREPGERNNNAKVTLSSNNTNKETSGPIKGRRVSSKRIPIKTNGHRDGNKNKVGSNKINSAPIPRVSNKIDSAPIPRVSNKINSAPIPRGTQGGNNKK